ncbi:MAG: hypothetical protein ACR2NX_14690 [Chthoniobacterales bacterium]
MRTVAAERELAVGLGKERPITRRELHTENAIIRVRAEGEIVPVNSTHRRALDLHFVELLFDSGGVAGGEFHPADDQGGKREVWFVHFHPRIFRIVEIDAAPPARLLAVNDKPPQQRGVAQPSFGAVFDRESFRARIRAIDERHVDLQQKARRDRVAGDQLRDRAVQMLIGRVRHFAAIELQRTEVSELLGHGKVGAVQPAVRLS